MRLLLLPLVSLVCACASQAPVVTAAPAAAPQAAAPAEAAAPAVEMESTPFTAAQIREGSPAGRRIVFKVEEDGKAVGKRTVEFVKSDESGADIRTTMVDEKGGVVETSTSHATWEELRAHALFPKAKVEVKHRTLAIPLGTLMCTVYKVTEGEGEGAESTTFYFADSMPGPPVFFFTEKGGKRLRASTMEASSTGK